jgi:pimeloyl-ACP methyl ester carboxylesterase
VATVLAVADAAGAERFRVFAASQGGQVAAAIAARYPERVEALVVYGMCASGRDLLPAGVFVTDPTAEDLAAFTRFERASASAAVAARMLEIYYETDIRALLSAIRVRTAVLHREADRGTRFELGREAAALIPGPILIRLPGSSHLLTTATGSRSLTRCSASCAAPRARGRG